ncbi:hypothetical protein B0H66DRAFT_568065 [Apodospora peruviana]|uniref:Uncharacterized protein n=1 Tax=Apodospora peruviana TaxID=516989 RepID=A0AAE0HYD8_9PEZI|nr:hypothetical protein B0H66DRAFT_568065 [Apodospora peruviana]
MRCTFLQIVNFQPASASLPGKSGQQNLRKTPNISNTFAPGDRDTKSSSMTESTRTSNRSSITQVNKDTCTRSPSDEQDGVEITSSNTVLIPNGPPRPMILSWMVIHLPPSLITIYPLPMLYFYSGPSWSPDRGIRLGWFLFAGKVYETLIVASLADILLYHIRYSLARAPRGVPFGALMAPYQLSNALYLFRRSCSMSLWTRITTRCTRQRRQS